jgi:simple sugar transport system permease protein
LPFESSFITVISLSAPIILVVLGETINEKSGVINLSIEGTLLITALTAFAVSVTTGSPFTGFICAGIIGSIIGLIIILCDTKLKMDQIAVGFILTIFLGKLSSFLGQEYVRIPGPYFQKVSIPVLKDIPYIGPSLFDQNAIVLFSFLMIPFCWYMIEKTRWGLIIKAVGENPVSAENRGIDPEKVRIIATVIGGFIIGLGGAAFSLHSKFGWSENHTGNYGWICLAIVIFGGWNPIRASMGAYFFGIFQIIALKLQSYALGLTQVLPLIPFPLMILTLVFIQQFNKSENTTNLPKVLGMFFGGQEPGNIGKPLDKK